MTAKQYTPMRVAPGDARYISVPGIAKPINTGSARAAALIVERVNAHAAIMAALELATATVELHTGNGARSQPAWPLDATGSVDYEAVARTCRAALAAATGAA